MAFKRAVLALGLGGVMAASAPAAIVSGALTGGSAFDRGGVFVQLKPDLAPFSVGFDNFNTDNLYAFDELQNVKLSSNLAANLGATSIAAGTVISSHVVFFDPLALRTTAKGTVKFSTPVLAVITLRPQLIASNFLGHPKVTYLDPASVGLEPGIDFVQIGDPTAQDLKIVTLDADSPGDLFRVITVGSAAVPEPSSWAMLLVGFGGLAAALRRHHARARRAFA